jgi:hypothetical protein
MKDCGIERLKNGSFCSDSYPDADTFTFQQVLMLERLHDLVDDIDFDSAWRIIQKVATSALKI